MTNGFLALLMLFLIIVLVLLVVMWLVERSSARQSDKSYGYASYRTFKYYFDRCNWTPSKYVDYALYDHASNSSYQEGTIIFNGQHMLIYDPFSFALAMLYARSYIRRGRKLPKAHFSIPKSSVPSVERHQDGFLVYISDGSPVFISNDEIDNPRKEES